MNTNLATASLALLEGLGDAVVIVDRNWRILAATSHAARLGSASANEGQTPADLVGTSLWDVWPASLRSALHASLDRAMETRAQQPATEAPANVAGRTAWFAFQALPFADGLAIVARDITNQRQRQSRAVVLQELTATLAGAMSPAEAGSVIIERALPALGAIAGNVYLLSDDGRDLVSIAALGYTPATLERARSLALDGPTMMADVVRGRSPIFLGIWKERLRRYPHHRQIHARDGDRAVAGLPLVVEDRIIGALSLTFPTDRTFSDDEQRDIVAVADLCAQALERTRLYEALRRSEAQARLVTDRAPTYLAHIDAECCYLYVNRGFADRLGRTPEEVIGQRVPDVIGEAGFAVVWPYLERALAGNEVEFEATVPYAVQGPRVVQVAYAPDRDDMGRVRGVVAVITDTTERQRAEFTRQLLADAGAILVSSLDAETIVRQIAEVAVPGFADACVTWLADDGVLRRVGVTHDDPGQEPAGLPPLPDVLTTPGAAHNSARRLIVSTYPAASITVPLHVDNQVAGALQFVLAQPDRRFITEDLWLAEELGRRCSTALENSRLYASLQESEVRFRQLADAIPKIAWVVGADGQTLEYINQRWHDLIGAPIAAGLTPISSEHLHPADRDGTERAWSLAARQSEPFSCELRLRTRDGSYRWFLCRIEPVLDAAGRVVKWFGAATDINDTKRAAEAQRFLAELSSTLAESLDPTEILRRVTRLMIPALADYCFIDLVQPDGSLQRVSWAHFDPQEQQVLDRNMRLHVPEALPPDHPVSRVVSSGEPHLVADVTDAWLQRLAYSADHLAFLRERGLRSRMSVPLMARGRRLGALTFCTSDLSGRRYDPEQLDLARDVAERIAFAIDNARLYTEAREAEAKVSRLLDAGVVGVIVADQQQVMESNDHFLEMTGYSRDDLAHGRLRWAGLTPPEFSALDARGTAELLEQGVCIPYEKEYFRQDGSRIPILTGSALLEREPLRWISFILDLTERKRSENEWRAFIDATAHDLRNPLTSVLGQTQLIQRRMQRDGALNPDDAGKRLAAIASAAVTAAGLIDDLIDTARLRAGQPLEMRPVPVDLIALVSSCVEDARRVGPSHSIRIETALTSLGIVADEPRIQRVIRNILDNAIKFSPDGGDVLVKIFRDDDPRASWAVLTIEDRGLGIPETDLAYVFDQFRRGANVEGRIHGSGIGLSGAQQIVAQHGGQITAHSTEGEGSIFSLRLPILPPPE